MIQAIIFDYGGTIDTDSLHWSEVLWKGYKHASIPVSKEEFRTSYVVAERALAKHPYISSSAGSRQKISSAEAHGLPANQSGKRRVTTWPTTATTMCFTYWKQAAPS